MSRAPAAPEPSAQLPDWGAGRVPLPMPGRTLGLVIAAVVVVAGLVALAAPIIGAVVAVVLVAGLGLWVTTRGRAILRDAGARRLEPHDAPRFENIASGLSSDLGMTTPGLWIAEHGGPNAFVAWSGGPHIGVTRALLSDLARTELEAVVAHCLVRVLSGDAKATTMAIAIAPLPVGRARVGGPLDVGTAALTRYPPALARAIARMEPRRGRFARAWFASDEATHVPPDERVAALDDL